MTERRQLRDRVDQLRLEAGVSPSSESVEVRHARLLQLQMVSAILPLKGPWIFRDTKLP